MIIEIKGSYLIVDLVLAFQHLAAQLEDLGVEAVEDVTVNLKPCRVGGQPLAFQDDRGTVERLALEIRDLARPCVGSGALRVVETKPTQRAKLARRPAPRHRRMD